MANATTYLASPTFGIGPNLAGIKDLTDQCKSVVITKSREALDSTSFGNTGRQFVGGLTNVTVTATLLMEYSATPGTYVDLTALVGTNVYVAVKPTSAAISAGSGAMGCFWAVEISETSRPYLAARSWMYLACWALASSAERQSMPRAP